MRAKLTNARISPKKANLVAGLVRGMKVTDALDQLKFTPKKGAQILAKVIASAAANGVNNMAQDKEKLTIKAIIVTKGITYKRGIPVSRGRYHRMNKRNSNITVEIGIVEETKAATPTKKTTTKKAESPTPEKKEEKAEKKAAPKKTTTKKPAAKSTERSRSAKKAPAKTAAKKKES